MKMKNVARAGIIVLTQKMNYNNICSQITIDLITYKYNMYYNIVPTCDLVHYLILLN